MIDFESKCFSCEHIIVKDLQIDNDVLIEAYCLNEKGMKTKYEGCAYYHKRT